MKIAYVDDGGGLAIDKRSHSLMNCNSYCYTQHALSIRMNRATAFEGI